MIVKHGHWAIKQLDRTQRQIEFVASRQEVDADNEVIVTRGIALDRFRKNPILQLDHDALKRFGRVDMLMVKPVDGADALVGQATILPAGVSATADQAYGELVHGALGGVSMGFLSLETGPPILSGQRGQTHTKTELLEISCVSIPSCASCVVTGKSARFRSAPLSARLRRGGEIVLELAVPDDGLTRYEIDLDDLAAATRSAIREGFASVAAAAARKRLLYLSGRVE